MILSPNIEMQNIFLSCPRYCDRGLIVVIVYYFQILNTKEHNIISSFMGPMYNEIPYKRQAAVLFKVLYGSSCLC